MLTGSKEDDDDNDDNGSDGEPAGRKNGGRKDKSVPWPMDSDEDGWPIMPEGDNLNAPDFKDIIRSFVTLTYSKLRSIPSC
jgi:hypothetical protein